MKKIVIPAIALLMMLILSAAANELSGETIETTFAVGGMTCNSCVSRVGRAVAALDGIEKISINLRTGRVAVVHDSSVSADTIADAIVRAGYTARAAN